MIGEVIDDLDASIGFSLAGLAAAVDDFGARLVAATEPGGWYHKLRLLLAAEEVYAIGLLHVVRREDREVLRELGFRWVFGRRRIAAEVAAHLTAVSDRLSEGGTSFWRTAKRQRDATTVIVEACDVYAASLLPAEMPENFGASWARTLGDLQQVENAVVVYEGGASASEGSVPIDEAAEHLGEHFARQLPHARALVADLRRSRPGMTDGETIRHIKRQFVTRLQVDLTNEGDVFEDVALLATSLADVRGMTPQSKDEYAAIGRHLLDSAERIAGVHSKAGFAGAAVAAGFEKYLHKFQPMIIEAIFRGMEFANPGKAGVARDIYKAMRRQVWGARHDRNVGRAAGAGAARGVRTIADASAPRLIVRTVDRAISKAS